MDEPKPRAMEAKEKVEAIVDWFKGRQLPPVPIAISQGITIIDAKLFLQTQYQTLERNKILSLAWMRSAERLLALKKYIEKTTT